MCNISAFKSAVLEAITVESPGSMPYLTWNESEWKLENGVLWCATEKVSREELDRAVAIVKEVLLA